MLNYLSELAPYFEPVMEVVKNVTVLQVVTTYLACSLSTGLLSYYTVYRPILRSLREYCEEEDVYVFELEYPTQTALILITLNTFLAPLIFKTALTGPDKEFVSAYLDRVLPDEDDD